MTVYMLVLRPTRQRRLKAGGDLVLTVSLHKTLFAAQAAQSEASKQFPSSEGKYEIEHWGLH